MTYEKGIPDYAMVPAKEMEERIIVPITKGAIYSPVQVTDITDNPKTTIALEEDILVPDIKPDMREILLIDGKAHLSTREFDPMAKGDDYVNLSGDIELQTLYLPENSDENCRVVSIQTRIPFKERLQAQFGENSTVIIDCSVEKVEFMVVNERKFRVKILLAVTSREYCDTKVDVFEGLADEDIQVLKESVEISNIAIRKKDTMTIQEDLHIKDDSCPDSILKHDITIVENYKQISSDKIVINGFIYVNLLYLSSPTATGSDEENCATASVENIRQLQDRVEFTQFIPIQQGEQWSNCNLFFDDSRLCVKLVEDDDGRQTFRLDGELVTYIEIYHNITKEIIVDGYHRQKNFLCDFEEKNSKTLVGTCSGEASIREILSPKNSVSDIGRIVYTTAEVANCNSTCEDGKIVSEGTLLVKMICSGDDDGILFSVNEEIPFRVVSTMPQLTGSETVTHQPYIKDLWAEKINGKQLEFNASVLICTEVMRPVPFKILTNPSFEEPNFANSVPQMAVYICKAGDSLWQIAKKFKTTVSSLKNINDLESDNLSLGQKLLIIK